MVFTREDEEELWRTENRRLTAHSFWHGKVGKPHRVLKGVPEGQKRRKLKRRVSGRRYTEGEKKREELELHRGVTARVT